jgi:hypothetical protein
MSDLPNGLDAGAMKVAVAWTIVEKSYSPQTGKFNREKFVELVNTYVEAERALATGKPISEEKPKV